ncbi:MAG: hypothetical protein ACRD2N_10970 [Vicinamibacterales bacterium]
MKRLLYSALVAAIGLVALPELASAQAKQGDKEVSISGNMFSMLSEGSKLTTGQFIFGVGYFMTDRLQIAVNPILQLSAGSLSAGAFGGSGSSINADLGLSTKLVNYFGGSSSKVKPYLGANFVVESLKDAAERSFTAAVFGVKNYLTENAALDVNGSFGFNTKHPGDFQLLQVAVGIAYIF